MTPKEKASKLVVTFMSYTCDCYYYEDAKACALIAVEEILDLDSGDAVDKNYWQEVKQEIEKIA